MEIENTSWLQIIWNLLTILYFFGCMIYLLTQIFQHNHMGKYPSFTERYHAKRQSHRISFLGKNKSQCHIIILLYAHILSLSLLFLSDAKQPLQSISKAPVMHNKPRRPPRGMILKVIWHREIMDIWYFYESLAIVINKLSKYVSIYFEKTQSNERLVCKVCISNKFIIIEGYFICIEYIVKYLCSRIIYIFHKRNIALFSPADFIFLCFR